MKKNVNCLEGMVCPDCGSYGPFIIEVEALAMVHDDGVASVTDVQWEGTSGVACVACRHSGTDMDFRPKGDTNVTETLITRG